MRRGLATLVVLAGVASAALAASPAIAQGPAGGPSATASVIGGRTASIAEFPWLAFVAAKPKEGSFSCTGAVIAPRVVLTAGHCIEKPEELGANPPSSYRVVTGVADLRQTTRANVSTVSRAIFHPTFETAEVQVDAGLLILSAPVATPTLRLATSADSALLQAGTPLTISGWGVTRARAKEGPAVLQAGGLAVKPPGPCRRAMRPFEPYYSTVSQLCAVDTAGKASGCFGDSGGPAVATGADGAPVAVGIVASGVPGCDPQVPNILTRVDGISRWASDWVAKVEAGAPTPPVPQVAPPYLEFDHARELGAAALAKSLHGRFLRGTEKRASCKRLEWERVRCRVAWRLGGQRYRGTFTIELEVEGYRVLPRAQIAISSSIS
jgi:secreted trypsin-like serine protease